MDLELGQTFACRHATGEIVAIFDRPCRSYWRDGHSSDRVVRVRSTPRWRHGLFAFHLHRIEQCPGCKAERRAYQRRLMAARRAADPELHREQTRRAVAAYRARRTGG